MNNGHTRPLSVRAWWTMGSTAMSDLQRTDRFGVNVLIIEDDTQGIWSALVDGLALYEFSDHYQRDAAGRERVEAVRDHYRTITEAARQHGILSYVMCSEVFVPDGFEPVSYDNPHLWTLVYERLREVFRAVPCLDGFMLYLEEAKHSVVQLPGSQPSMTARYAKLINTVWQACQAERRKLLVTTFIHRPERLQAVAEALRGVPPHEDLAVVQYCCPNDWGLYELTNPSIGHVSPHPEILGFDYAAENWGQGTHPFIQVDFIAQRLRAAREQGANVIGIAGYVAWYGRSVLGTLNEANVSAAASLAKNPERDPADILYEWCTERFGDSAARVSASCLARTFEVVFKTQHVFGYWLDTSEKSGLPSLWELQNYLVEDSYGEALYKWDSRYWPVWDKIQAPDIAFVEKILGEKSEAIDLCRASLAELRAEQGLFRKEDYDCLQRAFVFQEQWAKMWRGLVHAFFLHRIGIVRGDMHQVEVQLREALATLSSEADKIEEMFGADVFPRGPNRARQFVRDLVGSAQAAELCTVNVKMQRANKPDAGDS